MKDLTILMDNQVGRAADMMTAAADRGIRIVAGCVFPRLGGRVGHLAVADEDVSAVAAVVEANGGVLADERECVIVPADYEGGVVAASSAVARAGITVNVGYFGARGEVVLATSDSDATRRALGLD
ncbi:MAG: hypothetical protein OEZ14_11580 [Acidimicrobiia bacterium]|nr:hypothetical protein [Acidimicrobiia bacterium]MDH4309407.1 hypothetical protein [Acidimicrobiia bacterium]MDH5521158.1 hypothetical protein [Acidimicrobiia bacterium]